MGLQAPSDLTDRLRRHRPPFCSHAWVGQPRGYHRGIWLPYDGRDRPHGCRRPASAKGAKFVWGPWELRIIHQSDLSHHLQHLPEARDSTMLRQPRPAIVRSREPIPISDPRRTGAGILKVRRERLMAQYSSGVRGGNASHTIVVDSIVEEDEYSPILSRIAVSP
jgi:hypothetical protein